MKKKSIKIFALMCGGHFMTNELYATKAAAEREFKSGYHKECVKHIVELKVHY